jgi:glucose/mannose-6-phosphate isomerase
MGGSGMACLLARSILAESLSVPCVVCQDPKLPPWIGPDTLVVIVTYSGETWEALRMLEFSLSRGARVLVVASGGRILDLGGTAESGRFRVPAGYAPRAALGWMIVPVLLALGGSAAAFSEGLERLSEEAELWKAGGVSAGRDPRALAERIGGKHAYIYAPGERQLPAAIRWKNQILENGKQMASAGAFPELVHNEIMGWSFACRCESPVFVVLEDPPGEPGARRVVEEEALRELRATGGEILRVPSLGRGSLARLLTHISLADMTSVELARRLGIDPLPIPAIERVKAACGKELFG